MAVAIPLMVVEGLNKDNYMINNPIWIDVKYIAENTKYLTINLLRVSPVGTVNEPSSIRLYPFNGKLYFDLAPMVKTFMARPQHPSSIGEDQITGTNFQTMRITLQQIRDDDTITETRTFLKNFVRAGMESPDGNLSLVTGTVLKESVLLPRWQGYPLAKYTLSGGSTSKIPQWGIRYNAIIPLSETEQRRVVGCNPMYFRFLNTKGGYSFWLFEDWSVEKSSDKPDIVENRGGDYSLGHELEYELEVTTRCERRYYKTMRALAQSFEVYAYNFTNIALNDTGADQTEGAQSKLATDTKKWETVINPGNKVETNSYEDVQEFKFKFRVNLKQKPALKW